MSKIGSPNLNLQPFKENDLAHIEQLLYQYPYKNYQLNQLEISKKKMVGFLINALFHDHVQNFCLWEERVVGFISLKTLPWLSDYFDLNMCSIQHLVGSVENQTHYETMLKYALNHLKGNDFWTCRVASNDIPAIHALENTGFRFVGSEVYLVRSLRDFTPTEDYINSGCEPCKEARLAEVLDIIDNNHFHNRYMYDPNIPSHKAIGIYKEFVSDCAFEEDFRLLIKSNGDEIDGFILYKFNTGLSKLMGTQYASLDFIGVKQGRKNAGVGVALNKGALLDLARAGVSHVVVRTLASNYPAIRICQKIGFKITSTDLHFHFWSHPQVPKT